jgi:hypothetical protein
MQADAELLQGELMRISGFFLKKKPPCTITPAA